MDNVIFPMQYVNISQRHYSAPSHQNLKAIDLAGQYSSATKIAEPAYASTRCKVLASGIGYNTVLFGTCDESGKPAAVHCGDGLNRILTYALTHADDISEYKVGRIFQSGELFYKEGSFGSKGTNSYPFHIHFEVAEGWKVTKKTIQGVYQLEDAIFPHLIFHFFKGWNVVTNTNGYSFLEVSSRSTEISAGSTARHGEQGIYLQATKQPFRIRNAVVTGAELAVVQVGQRAKLLEFLDVQADQYQWAKVQFNNVVGYSQIDTFNCLTISNESEQMCLLRSEKSAFYMRSAPVTGAVIKTIPAQGSVTVVQFLPIQKDQYQWASVTYQGVFGYCQVDTKKFVSIRLG